MAADRVDHAALHALAEHAVGQRAGDDLVGTDERVLSVFVDIVGQKLFALVPEQFEERLPDSFGHRFPPFDERRVLAFPCQLERITHGVIP